MALLTLISWCPLPSPWFIFFNAVVVAIAVMSTSGASAGASRGRLCRSGSSMVLDRLRSFFVFPAGHLPIDETTAAHCCSREAAEAASSATQVRAPERNPRAVTSTTPGDGDTAAIGTAQPSASVAMAAAQDHAPTEEQEEEEEDNAEAEKEQDHDESISLDQAYALAQRHRAKPLASPPPAAAAAASAAAAPAAALPTEHEKKKPAKVVADRRRVSKAGEALEGKAELNARAELFIRQFREDLRLQRLNSILKHTHALGSPTAAR